MQRPLGRGRGCRFWGGNSPAKTSNSSDGLGLLCPLSPQARPVRFNDPALGFVLGGRVSSSDGLSLKPPQPPKLGPSDSPLPPIAWKVCLRHWYLALVLAFACPNGGEGCRLEQRDSTGRRDPAPCGDKKGGFWWAGTENSCHSRPKCLTRKIRVFTETTLFLGSKMALCQICGKGTQVGYNVSHAHNKTKKRWSPNIQTVRVQKSNGNSQKLTVCTSCIRSNKVTAQ